MKQIVIATDGSPAAREAVVFGVALAADEGSAVTFVHVLPPDEFVAARLAPPLVLPHPVAVDDTETALREAEELAMQAGVAYALERISGEVVDEILAVAEARQADLIVVGTRGHGAVAATFLGSVSRGLVSRADRPVLVVKGMPVPAVA